MTVSPSSGEHFEGRDPCWLLKPLQASPWSWSWGQAGPVQRETAHSVLGLRIRPWRDGVPLNGLLWLLQKHRRGGCSQQPLNQGLKDGKLLPAWRRRGRRLVRRMWGVKGGVVESEPLWLLGIWGEMLRGWAIVFQRRGDPGLPHHCPFSPALPCPQCTSTPKGVLWSQGWGLTSSGRGARSLRLRVSLASQEPHAGS